MGFLSPQSEVGMIFRLTIAPFYLTLRCGYGELTGRERNTCHAVGLFPLQGGCFGSIRVSDRKILSSSKETVCFTFWLVGRVGV